MTTPNTPALTEDLTMKEYGWTLNQYNVIKRMYFNKLDADQISVFGYICKKSGLDPFVKQIYAIIRGGSLCAQTGIDGYRVAAERTGRYSPGREPVFNESEKGIISCTAFIKKMTADGTWHEVAATAYFKEYTTGSGFWSKMPHGQIAKCAEALALRKAFPDLSGVYTKEEMDQAGQADNLMQADCEVSNPQDTSTKSSTQDTSKPAESSKKEQITLNSEAKLEETVKISPEQFLELGDLWEKCSSEYKRKFSSHMQTSWGAFDLDQIPATAFEMCKASMTKNKDETENMVK